MVIMIRDTENLRIAFEAKNICENNEDNHSILFVMNDNNKDVLYKIEFDENKAIVINKIFLDIAHNNPINLMDVKIGKDYHLYKRITEKFHPHYWKEFYL